MFGGKGEGVATLHGLFLFNIWQNAHIHFHNYDAGNGQKEAAVADVSVFN